jgi:hypothetical protein
VHPDVLPKNAKLRAPMQKASNCFQLEAFIRSIGRRGGIRTRYPLHPIQVLAFPLDTKARQVEPKKPIKINKLQGTNA